MPSKIVLTSEKKARPRKKLSDSAVKVVKTKKTASSKLIKTRIAKKASVRPRRKAILDLPYDSIQKDDLLPISEVKPRKPVDDFFAKPSVKPKKGLGFYFSRLAAFIILLAVLAFCIDIYGIYQMSWHGSISHQVAHILPLPAATVNSKIIKLSDYFDDVDVLQIALSNQREGLSDQIISPDNKSSVIDRLVLINIINEQLKKYGQSVSEQDLNSNLDSIITQFNGRSEAESNVKKLYGINLDQFKAKVLKPLLAKNLLQSQIVKDDNLTVNRDAKAKAEMVLELALRPGANFSDLAKQYTEDEAGINTGGDLGFVSRGEATPEIEQILFSLPANTVYDKIITNNVGYHIIMVENKLTDPSTNKESVQAKQILIKVDVDKYLRDLMAGLKVVKYIK